MSFKSSHCLLPGFSASSFAHPFFTLSQDQSCENTNPSLFWRTLSLLSWLARTFSIWLLLFLLPDSSHEPFSLPPRPLGLCTNGCFFLPCHAPLWGNSSSPATSWYRCQFWEDLPSSSNPGQMLLSVGSHYTLYLLYKTSSWVTMQLPISLSSAHEATNSTW